ncbi:pO174L [African swine fever virus]|uniref:PO174L n=1 Tax=African swine fever virus TaxID=10497 RepID=A0A8A1V6P2_ASF|nr:pO174L [African swine fever virus]
MYTFLTYAIRIPYFFIMFFFSTVFQRYYGLFFTYSILFYLIFLFFYRGSNSYQIRNGARTMQYCVWLFLGYGRTKIKLLRVFFPFNTKHTLSFSADFYRKRKILYANVGQDVFYKFFFWNNITKIHVIMHFLFASYATNSNVVFCYNFYMLSIIFKRKSGAYVIYNFFSLYMRY